VVPVRVVVALVVVPVRVVPVVVVPVRVVVPVLVVLVPVLVVALVVVPVRVVVPVFVVLARVVDWVVVVSPSSVRVVLVQVPLPEPLLSQLSVFDPPLRMTLFAFDAEVVAALTVGINTPAVSATNIIVAIAQRSVLLDIILSCGVKWWYDGV
jgi:hypothetical protein